MPQTRITGDAATSVTVNNTIHLNGADANTYLANVALSSVSNGQTILFSGANNTWYNATPAAGGGGTTSNTLANIPAAATDGKLFFPTDGYNVYRDNGSTWTAFGPLYRFVTPNAASFSWNNQGNATLVTNPCGSMTLVVPNNASDNIRSLVINTPSTPYTITAWFRIHATHYGNYQSFGFIWISTGDGKLTQCLIDQHYTAMKTNFGANKMNNVGSYNSSYSGSSIVGYHTLYAARVSDNGTYRNASGSMDGTTWVPMMQQISRTDWHTPDRVGIFGMTTTASSATQYVTLLSWEVT